MFCCHTLKNSISENRTWPCFRRDFKIQVPFTVNFFYLRRRISQTSLSKNTPNLNEKSNFSKIHTGVVVHTIIFFFLLTWNVYANAHTTLYTVAFFYGTADGAWCTQIYSIIGRCVDPSNISFLNDIIFLSSSSYILWTFSYLFFSFDSRFPNDMEASFSTYRMWNSIGMASAFYASAHWKWHAKVLTLLFLVTSTSIDNLLFL